MTIPRALRPLRHTAYRWLAASLLLSLTSSGLWIVAMVWQVVGLGGGPGELSKVAAVSAIGMLITTLLGGALADRLPQRRILAVVELVRAASIGAVALLAVSGAGQTWHLVVASFLGGVMTGFYYPAYSALLPSVLPEEELLAANGFEGAVRPLFMQAGGPAVASMLIAAYSPAFGLLATAICALGAAWCVSRLDDLPVRRDLEQTSGHPAVALLVDVRDGFRYVARTPWLLGTLAFASLLILVIMGPFEVLVPFAIRAADGGPSQHAWVLAAFGIGGAVGSMIVASRPMPRRYLTVMNLLWAGGCIPLAVFGLTDRVVVMAAAAFVVGAAFNGGVVIWGTLLQRRVPPAMLGRVSSLDFFISLAFMPVSMALAGPAGDLVGVTTVFLVAGLAPLLIGAVAIIAAKMTTDEIAHPLAPDPEPETSAPPVRVDERLLATEVC